GSEAAKNVAPQPAGIDGRRDGRRADTDHRGHPHPGDDDAQGERQLDLKQQLAVGHAHAAAGIADRRIDAADAGERIANDRQERVERQRHDRGARADAADDLHMEKINIERYQKAEQRQARHRLHDVGETEHGSAERRLARENNAQRHADRNRDAGGDRNQKQVLEGERGQLARIAREELDQAQASLPLLWASWKHSAKARASGSAECSNAPGWSTRTSRPSLSRATRLASAKASAMSWVTKTMVFLSSCWSVLNSR